jgi:hypothetical protein
VVFELYSILSRRGKFLLSSLCTIVASSQDCLLHVPLSCTAAHVPLHIFWNAIVDIYAGLCYLDWLHGTVMACIGRLGH